MTSAASHTLIYHLLDYARMFWDQFLELLTVDIPMQGPGPDSRIVYMDGAFDLFHAGHVEVNMNSFPHAFPPENG
jgi:hypothetical protein